MVCRWCGFGVGDGPGCCSGTVFAPANFGGPYQILNDVVGKPFSDMKLGRVEYDVEVSPSVIAKLQTQRGNPPFDVAMVSRPFGLRSAKAGPRAVSAADFPEIKALILMRCRRVGGSMIRYLRHDDRHEQVKEPITSWLDL